MPKQFSLVSIVIVNYNGAHLLRECLTSVFAQPYRPIEVIVVDNGSTDGSAALVKTEFAQARLIALDRNAGFAEGNNIGVREANAEFVVLLNNDTVVEKNWLPPLFAMMNDPTVAIAASKVLTEGVPAEFYTLNGTINYLGYNIMRAFADLSMIFYAGGTSLMFRRSVVGEPFLSEYFLYHEDVYLSWRMRLRGYDVRMAQQSVVYHRGSATTQRQASALVTFYQVRNRMLNLFLLDESRTLVKLAPFILLDVLGTLFRSLISTEKSLLGTLRAYRWLLTHLAWIRQQRAREQAERRVGDEAVLSLVSADVVDAARSGSVGRLMNPVARLYARRVGLPFYG